MEFKAAGKIGRPIVARLLETGLYTVTALTRDASKHSNLPSEVKIKEVDYSSVASLKSALPGQDADVSDMAFEAIEVQAYLVVSAVEAGFKLMIPSENNKNTHIPLLASVPIYQPKIAIRE